MGPPLPATSLFLCSPAHNKLSQEGLEVVHKLLHHLSILASTRSNQTCLHHLAGTGLVKATSYLLSKKSAWAVTQPALSFMLAASATQRSPDFPPKLYFSVLCSFFLEHHVGMHQSPVSSTPSFYSFQRVHY